MIFFSRCKKLLTVLIILCFVIGIALGIMLFEVIMMDYELSTAFLAVAMLWIVLLLITAALKCIVKDAEEDLNAVMKYQKDKE